MSQHLSLPRIDHQISRRSLLHGGVAAAALAALPSCGSTGSQHSAGSPHSAGPISAFALANGRVNQVLLLSRPRGKLRFQPPLQVTTTAFDPHSPTSSGGKHGAWWIGDYQGITAGAGAVHLVWNDTRTGKLALYAA